MQTDTWSRHYEQRGHSLGHPRTLYLPPQYRHGDLERWTWPCSKHNSCIVLSGVKFVLLYCHKGSAESQPTYRLVCTMCYGWGREHHTQDIKSTMAVLLKRLYVPSWDSSSWQGSWECLDWSLRTMNSDLYQTTHSVGQKLISVHMLWPPRVYQALPTSECEDASMSTYCWSTTVSVYSTLLTTPPPACRMWDMDSVLEPSAPESNKEGKIWHNIKFGPEHKFDNILSR